MIRSLLKLAAVLVVCILVYNYFFGTSEEKTQSQEVFEKARALVVAGAQVLKGEKAKFDAGKYDGVMEQLGEAYRALRKQVKNMDAQLVDQLDDLEKRKNTLQQQLDEIEKNDSAPTPETRSGKKGLAVPDIQSSKAADQARKKQDLQRALDSLVQDSERLIQQASQK